MMIKKRKINKLLVIIMFIISGCSGTLIGYDNLDSLYKNNISSKDLSIYYNMADGSMMAAVKNISSTFMTNLNMSLECVYDNGDIITDIHSLSNLKTYFYKNVVFKIDYEQCKSLVLKYIYYPQEDGGFIFTDRFGSYTMPVENNIPVEDIIVIK